MTSLSENIHPLPKFYCILHIADLASDLYNCVLLSRSFPRGEHVIILGAFNFKPWSIALQVANVCTPCGPILPMCTSEINAVKSKEMFLICISSSSYMTHLAFRRCGWPCIVGLSVVERNKRHDLKSATVCQIYTVGQLSASHSESCRAV